MKQNEHVAKHNSPCVSDVRFAWPNWLFGIELQGKFAKGCWCCEWSEDETSVTRRGINGRSLTQLNRNLRIAKCEMLRTPDEAIQLEIWIVQRRTSSGKDRAIIEKLKNEAWVWIISRADLDSAECTWRTQTQIRAQKQTDILVHYLATGLCLRECVPNRMWACPPPE